MNNKTPSWVDKLSDEELINLMNRIYESHCLSRNKVDCEFLLQKEKAKKIKEILFLIDVTRAAQEAILEQSSFFLRTIKDLEYQPTKLVAREKIKEWVSEGKTNG